MLFLRFYNKLKNNIIEIFKTLFFHLPIPDFFYLKIYYRIRIGKRLNLRNPVLYNEKIQWLKLYDINPDYPNLVDKYEVRKYITKNIGEEYLIPLYGVWNTFDEIPFDMLPDQFVLKCTHDCGSIIICKDKSKLDIKNVRKHFIKCLSRNYYYRTREWPYKNIKPRIIAEKFMEAESIETLTDYRFFCFNGKPKAIFCDSNILEKKKNIRNIYNVEWNYIPLSVRYPTDPNRMVKKPEKIKEMLNLIKILSKDIPHIRVDFYTINNKIYFGN